MKIIKTSICDVKIIKYNICNELIIASKNKNNQDGHLKKKYLKTSSIFELVEIHPNYFMESSALSFNYLQNHRKTYF